MFNPQHHLHSSPSSPPAAPRAANERTFLHWLNIAVTLGSIAAAMLGVTGHVHKHWGSDYTKTAMATRVVALLMMITAIFVAAYATFLFSARASLLKCAPAACADTRAAARACVPTSAWGEQ